MFPLFPKPSAESCKRFKKLLDESKRQQSASPLSKEEASAIVDRVFTEAEEKRQKRNIQRHLKMDRALHTFVGPVRVRD